MKDLLDAIYPRADRPDYVVRLEPIQTTKNAVFQYLTTEEELARYPSHTPRSVVCCWKKMHHNFIKMTHECSLCKVCLSSLSHFSDMMFFDIPYSARESPVAWEGEPMEGADNNQANQRSAPESHSSTAHTQGQRRWEPEEEAKEEQPQPEDEGSTSGVGY